jgi:glycosyltransferase involved in cell wall biosynthesis
MIILFFASYPTLPIGYSRIGNILSNYLAEQGHKIYYLGISNFKNQSVQRDVHPNIKIIDALVEEKKKGSDELYGVNVVCDLLLEIKPDLLFIYNDIIVISRIFNNFIERKIKTTCKTFKTFVYLDLVYPYEKIELVKHINQFSDKIFVFSDCWKENLEDMSIDSNKILIMPHGVDRNIFFQVNKIYAREVFGFKEDDFIILNTNRNNYRKCIDKTVDAFIKFLKIKDCNPKIKLFLNMNFDSTISGYDVINQIKIACIINKLDYQHILNNHIFKSNSDKNMSDEMLNNLYNCCDVGINTCVGEGFGLCNLEHASLGRPQIVSGVGALNDIFTNEYSTVIKPVAEIYIPDNIDFHGGYIKICSTDDIVDAMVKYYDNPNLCKDHGKKTREIILKKYNWEKILKELDLNLRDIH